MCGRRRKREKLISYRRENELWIVDGISTFQIPDNHADVVSLGKSEAQEEEDRCQELGHGLLMPAMPVGVKSSSVIPERLAV